MYTRVPQVSGIMKTRSTATADIMITEKYIRPAALSLPRVVTNRSRFSVAGLRRLPADAFGARRVVEAVGADSRSRSRMRQRSRSSASCRAPDGTLHERERSPTGPGNRVSELPQLGDQPRADRHLNVLEEGYVDLGPFASSAIMLAVATVLVAAMVRKSATTQT
ncbi:hypothetical protein [Dactylosporangium sp. CA-092794]|uniref:hypothetical protein n=1 Tax=Dactylosporangium sp. CA-092794 TaxID=3239929 RepID=UPI003D94CBB3